jgi:hypothetical protein
MEEHCESSWNASPCGARASSLSLTGLLIVASERSHSLLPASESWPPFAAKIHRRARKSVRHITPAARIADVLPHPQRRGKCALPAWSRFLEEKVEIELSARLRLRKIDKRAARGQPRTPVGACFSFRADYVGMARASRKQWRFQKFNATARRGTLCFQLGSPPWRPRLGEACLASLRSSARVLTRQSSASAASQRRWARWGPADRGFFVPSLP